MDCVSRLQALQQAEDRQALRSAVEHVTRLHERRLASGPCPLLIHSTGQQQRLERLLQVSVQVRNCQQRWTCACRDGQFLFANSV
jgi:hypothetical protein